jgi:hypothetical protein
MQKDCQTVFAHPDWKEQRLSSLTAAWYQREVTVPAQWSGRRLTLRFEQLNSYAVVYVDSRRAGEMHFPGGELDVTSTFRPGATHVVSVLTVALPLKGVMLSYTDSASAREVKGTVARRGLCGDVYLVSTPTGSRVEDVKIETSVRKKEFSLNIALTGLGPDARYTLHARIMKGGQKVKDFASRSFQGRDLKDGHFTMVEKWMPEQLWDIHTPKNTFDLELSLRDAVGKMLDTSWTVRFGFRELWTEGRDFFLNGSRLYLSVVPLDNAQVSAAAASYAGARESLERLRSFGINFVYTHNYGCEPGAHLGFTEILRAADDVGMLVSFSQPHFSHYEWQAMNADRDNGYARHAEFYVRTAQNHPSVVMYSMSHNATGYMEDMNPDLMDGVQDPRDRWAQKNVKLALRAEAIVNRLDPSRIVYHHASGNLSSMHVINFYPNFVPIQELSDWFGPWSSKGVKPVFLCEYGAPFSWDWAMYRGWYKGQREFGSARVPWEFCLAEWNAQFLGDQAFQISETEKANLRWEAKQFQAGKVWHRWDYPSDLGSTRFTERYPVFAMYLTDNWRSFRTWGVSAFSPWEHGHFWKLREGVDKRRKDCPVDGDNLQRPGFSPDFVEQRYERMDLAFERADWIPTPAADALYRNNQPLLAWLGGKAEHFTSKDHNFLPGEKIEKQIIIINNSRETVTGEARWSLGLPQKNSGSRPFTIKTGQQEHIALLVELDKTVPTGQYPLDMEVKFSNGETQRDNLSVNILPLPTAQKVPQGVKIALFDPQGETAAWLARLKVPVQVVEADTSLSGFDILIVGKAALTTGRPAPDIMRVREGLKVMMFEQTSEVLERRFGFRVAEYGLRQLFPRVPDHPVLNGFTADHLRDWRGAATILPARLKYETRPGYGPTVRWCDLPETRLWRCGNQGNVASVLIEKPACGDFLPILDGGFGLQYSPLLVYREGQGMVVFCQLDLTGRTETEPAAEALARNLLQYVIAWKPTPRRSAVYAGSPAGKTHLELAGIPVTAYGGNKILTNQVLIVGPGAPKLADLSGWLNNGGNLLAMGLNQSEADALISLKVTLKKAEHIASCFPSPGQSSMLAGIGPQDVHNRDPREFPLVTAGAQVIGDGILAVGEHQNVVFCQMVPWQFGTNQPNLKRTYRRTSYMVSRLLGNLGVSGATPLLDRFHRPIGLLNTEKRYLTGLYRDQPEEWDDPYRFFRW